MVVSENPDQLPLFPEIGYEGRWLAFPCDSARVDPDLAALCSKYGFARLCQDDLGATRKHHCTVSGDHLVSQSFWLRGMVEPDFGLSV